MSDATSYKDQTSPGARILRETLRTPAFRQILALHCEQVDSNSGSDIAKVLLDEDVNFSLSMVAKSPVYFNAFVNALVTTGQRLGEIPPEMLKQFTENMRDEFDVEALKALPDAWLPIFNHVLKQNPKLGEEGVAIALQGLNTMLLALCDLYEKHGSDVQIPLDGQVAGKSMTMFSKIIQNSIRTNPSFAREVVDNIDVHQVLSSMWTLFKFVTKVSLLFIGKGLGSLIGRNQKGNGK